MRWDEVTPEMVSKGTSYPKQLRLFGRYCQQTVGTPMPMEKEWAALARRVKAFFIEYPTADWYTLCRVAQWCKSHKVRPRTAVGLVGCFRSAWADGQLPELDPQHVDLEVERRIERALEVEENEQWRNRLFLARGVEARRKLADQWEQRSVRIAKAATSGRRASSASSTGSSSTTNGSPKSASASISSEGLIVLDLGLPPAPPLSINQANTMHWARRDRELEPWRTAACVLAGQAKIPERVAGRRGRVRVVLPFKKRVRRDPHNYVSTVVKAVVDGLVYAGVWPDDTPEYVEVLEPRLVIGKNAEVEIEVK
jgi:crossover junction endodeoxyribonuclease RusA